MTKEILLYSSIYSYTAANFINELEANKENDICVRGNCPGGDMLSTYGMIAKFKEHPKAKYIKVDGVAASAFAYMLCFADTVECLDASIFLFHRAAFGDMEQEKMLDENDRKILESANAQIRAAMETKVSSEQFKLVTGYGYDELFSTSQRLDVVLNAKQMKDLGIVTNIVKLTAEKKAEVMSLSNQFGIAAFAKEPVIESNNNNTHNMTAQEFKAAHPAVYAEIVKEGVTAERKRVSALSKWAHIDGEVVMKAIADGIEPDAEFINDMSVKALSNKGLQALGEESAQPLNTGEQQTTVTAEAATLKTFNDEVKNNLKRL